MFQKQHHHQQACTLLCTRTYVVFLFLGWDLAIYCTYVPRVCCVIPCPILLVRTSFHTVFSCDNNSVFITLHSEHQQIFWSDVSNSVLRHPVSYIVSAYLVSYCLLVRPQQRFHHPTLRTSTVILVGCIEQSTISGKHVHCCILVHVSCFFGGLGCCPLLYVLTSCVLRHPVSYFVSAYLV